MAVRTIEYFKEKFKTGYKITQEDYNDLLDSFRHASTPVPLSDTTGISGFLEHYRRKDQSVDVADVEGFVDKISEILKGYLTSASVINTSQVEGLTKALSGILSTDEIEDIINTKLNQDFIPSISEKSTWIIHGEDTGISAVGQDGQSPSISEKGTWVFGDTETDLRANWTRVVDQNESIDGVRDGKAGGVFKASKRFDQQSLAVYYDGLRLTEGRTTDYQVLDDQSIRINRMVGLGTKLIFEYLHKL